MGITAASGFGVASASSGSCSVNTNPNPITQNTLIIAFAFEETTGAAGVVSDNGVDGAAYTLIATENVGGGILTAWIRNAVWGNVSTIATFTYTGGGSGTKSALFIEELQGVFAAGSAAVRQIASNAGSSGATPSCTFGVTPLTPDAVWTGGAQSNAAQLSTPSGYSGGTARTATGISLLEAYKLSSVGITTTWGAAAIASWWTMAIELIPMGQGSDMGRPSLYTGVKQSGAWSYTFNAGTRRKSGQKMLYSTLQNAAVEIDVVLIDTVTGQGFLGLASQVVSQIRNPGGNFATFSPTSVTSRGNGHFSVVIPGSATSALGINALRFTTSSAQAQPMAQANDDYSLDVVAYNKQDGVRLGLSALPNAAAGANTGLPVVGSQVPNANAGANGGLPVQGGAIPNAGANAVGGLPIVTAVSQGTGGGQIKPNSMLDNYVYGVSSGSTGKAVSWRVRVFASKAACDAATAGNPNNTDNEVERYLGSSTYNTDGTLASYKFDKDL
jgi:hypothetical protein